jgi:hypothetical protein
MSLGGMLLFVESVTMDVDGVDVVIGALTHNKGETWTWSCRWCSVTEPAEDRWSAYDALVAHAEPGHEAEVDVAWRVGRATPQVLGACPEPVREWAATLLQRYGSHVLFVTLFGARVVLGPEESSSAWDIQVDLRPSVPDGLQAQIRQDTELAAAAPQGGARLWIDNTPDDGYWDRLQGGWQRIADVPEAGSSVSPISVNAPDDSYQWHCDLCGAHGITQVGSEGTRFPSPHYVRAARDAARRADVDCATHMRDIHGWSELQ